MSKSTLLQQYENEAAADATIRDRAERCAKLSKPWLLPEDGHGENDEFENNYQSVGSNGLTIFVGKLMDLVFPVGRPFFKLDLAPAIRYAEGQDERTTQQRLQALFLRELSMMAMLETGSMGKAKRRSRRTSFRTKKYQALLQCVGTGDVLEQLTDDYRIKVFRRDQWTCRRDSSGDPLHFLIKEKIDIFGIKVKGKENAQVREEINLHRVDEDNLEERMQPMATRCKYQPQEEKWLIEQEINGVVFNTSTEPVSPFFSTPYELVSPEHYGRGLIENNLGDLEGLDNLERNLLDVMGNAAKWHPVTDPSSDIRPKDLEQPTGTVLVGRVVGGQPQDVGVLSMAMPREYTILSSGIDRKTTMLGRSFLTEIEAMPEGDRVTATAIVRVAREIELATGGVMSSVSDDQQVPLLHRLEYQMERDKLLTPLPREGYNIVSVTGINALNNGQRANDLLGLAQLAAQMPEEARSKIDYGVLLDAYARQAYLHEPGLIKSREQVQQELAERQQQLIQQQAAAKGVDVLGNAAEQQLINQQQ